MGLQLNLDERVAVITGGGQGLCRAFALGLAEAGADIVVSDFDEQKIKEVSDAVKDTGRRAVPVKVDVKKPDSVQSMTDKAISELGRIDILFNITEPGQKKLILDMGEDEWRDGIDAYLASYLLCSNSVARHMASKNYGKVINVISMFGTPGAIPGFSLYGASMAGVVMLTKMQAVEWAQYNIRVNAIAFGWVYTPESDSILKYNRFEQKIRQHIPLQKIAQPEEIARVGVFLASDASDYMTGAVVVVDGGMTALSPGAIIMQ